MRQSDFCALTVRLKANLENAANYTAYEDTRVGNKVDVESIRIILVIGEWNEGAFRLGLVRTEVSFIEEFCFVKTKMRRWRSIPVAKERGLKGEQ